MSYNTVADIYDSMSLRRRMYAAAAEEHKEPNPTEWVDVNAWALASSPGWEAAWDSAVAGGITDPGAEDGVITDGMILGAVQPLP
jgi:hypothetical protein